MMTVRVSKKWQAAAVRQKPVWVSLEDLLEGDLQAMLIPACPRPEHPHALGASLSSALRGDENSGWLVRQMVQRGFVRPAERGLILWNTSGRWKLRRFCLLEPDALREVRTYWQARAAERSLAP